MTLLQTTASIQLTYEDYRLFPDDGHRHEIIEGENHQEPAPNIRHQRISAKLFLRLGSFVDTHDLGECFTAPVDVLLSPIDVVQPDLLFVATEHLDRLTEANLQGAPDLAVEIVSESTRDRDELTKRHLYARHGVTEYWLIDPANESVTVYRLEGRGDYGPGMEHLLEDGDQLESPLFPGFSLPLAELFG